MPPKVKLQILLRADSRSRALIEETKGRLEKLGIDVTGTGLATISGEITPELFQNVFGVQAQNIPPRQAGAGDFGRSGGYTSLKLSIPGSLANHVQSISAAPPHINL